LGEIQNIEKAYECFYIEKRKESGCPRVPSPLEVEALAIQRIANTAEDLGREGRGVWKP
jgi:hypothetical protein